MQHQTPQTDAFLRMLWRRSSCVHHRQRSQKGQTALKDVLGNSKPSQGKVDLLQLDLNSLQSVRECAADFLSKSKTLNVLINNAGMLAYCC